jgi:hypothetical protein
VLPAADAEAADEREALPEGVVEALPEAVIEALPAAGVPEELPAEGLALLEGVALPDRVALPDGHEGAVLTLIFWSLHSWTPNWVVAVILVSWHMMRKGKRHTSDIRLRAWSKYTARHSVDYFTAANACNVGNTTGT